MQLFKNVCSKQVGGGFLVYSSLVSIAQLNVLLRKMCFKASGRLLINLFIFNQYRSLKCFTTNFIIRFLNCCFLVYLANKASSNGCFLVYSSNFVKLLWTAAFSLFIKYYETSINDCFWFKVIAFWFIH